jgi:hypothetical protein
VNDGVSQETAVVTIGIVERVMEAAAFFSGEGAIDDEGGYGGEIAKFQEIGGDFVMPIEFLDFALEIAEAGAGALEALVCADDADVIPHEAADFLPIVVDDNEFIDVEGVADAPFGDGNIDAVFADGDSADDVDGGTVSQNGGLEE